MTTHFKSRAPHRDGPSTRRGGFRPRASTGFSQYRGSRSFNRAPNRAPRSRSVQGIDVSRLINKAPATPESMQYSPTHRFIDFEIDSRIKSNIEKKGYLTPTPIQDQAIPHILAGRDIVGIANTGTGKTGAFLVPLLDEVVRDRSKRILIIVPTRELAQQIDEEFKGFALGSGFLSVCAVGGGNINPQIRRLQEDPFFVIGTPGRLKDLMER